MIKAVIFDFFGVLVTEGFKQFCDTYFPDDKEKRKKALELVSNHDAGRITKEDYMQGLVSLAGVSYATVNDHMSSNEPNKPLLDYIRTRLKPNYKLGVLSNSGDDYIAEMLEESDVEMFDDVILSYRHGMVKPSEEIFHFAAKRLGVQPQSCIFVDDSANHVSGANQAGMKPILYQDFSQFKKELETLLASPKN